MSWDPTPTTGDIHTIGLRQWLWNGIGWERIRPNQLTGGVYVLTRDTFAEIVEADPYVFTRD